MAVDSSTLKSLLKSSLKDVKENEAAQSKFINAVKEHITEKLELNGTYKGLLTNGSPDPANGAHVWKVSSFVTNSKSLEAKTSMKDWSSAILEELKKVTFNPSDDKTLVSVSTAPKLDITSLNLSETNSSDMDTSMGKIADEIISALTSIKIVPTPITATSTGGGTGTVQFSSYC